MFLKTNPGLLRKKLPIKWYFVCINLSHVWLIPKINISFFNTT